MTTKVFVTVTEYTCSKCKVTKPIDQFWKRASAKNTHDCTCISCRKIQQKALVDPAMPKKNSERRNYAIKKEQLDNGITLVKFGDIRQAQSASYRTSPLVRLGSSLGNADFFE